MSVDHSKCEGCKSSQDGSCPVFDKDKQYPDIGQVLLVASGKGGVGKSTVAVNLAVAMKAAGTKVGLMDADIYGPSIPAMLNLSGPPMSDGEKILPLMAHGMPVISIGFMTRDEDALIWRGPILHQVLTQFVNDVKWGPLDYLVIDLPPGTGDVQISLAQLVKASAALLVSTPQDIAFRDVRRAGTMFKQVNVPIIGLVENMSYFVCPACGKKTEVFPVATDAGRREITPGVNIDVLARIPLEPSIAKSSEDGTPIFLSAPESDTAKQFGALARTVMSNLEALLPCEIEKVK